MAETVTRSDLAEAIYKEVGISLSESNRIVAAVFEEIIKALEKENNVKISSFGSFYLKEKKARKGRNPKTLEEFEISERQVVSFYASNFLKQKINEDQI